MYTGCDFLVTNPGEKETYGLDFVNDLPSGDSLSAVSFSLTVAEGDDPTPSTHLDGLPNIVGTVALQTLSGLLANNNYLLKCTATTTNGSTLILFSHIRCLNPS